MYSAGKVYQITMTVPVSCGVIRTKKGRVLRTIAFQGTKDVDMLC